MKKLFITLYLGIVGTLFLFLILANILTQILYFDDEAEIERNQFKVQSQLLQTLAAVDKQGINSQFKPLESLNHYRYQRLEKERLSWSSARWNYLKEKQAIFDLDDDNIIYLYLSESELIKATRLEENQFWQQVDAIDGIILQMLYLSIAISTALWLLFLHRKLARLNETAKRIADGDLGARAPTQSRLQVGDLNTTFNSMAEKVQQLLQRNKQLTSAIAHEIRSPVFRIECQLEMLASNKLDESQMATLGSIHDDLDEVSQLIDELLNYARMERSEVVVKKEMLNIEEHLSWVLESLQRESQIKFEINYNTTDLLVLFDSKLMERAINNLIRNAIKFASEHIDVYVTKSESDILLTVDDDGPGIPLDKREDVVQPFHRLDPSRTKQTGGFGLGLAIVSEIISLHNGSLTIGKSKYGGASLQLCWPQKKEEA
ncbi:ATP-binding protein [Pleionea sp. CnH1-48]|uniref:ATP-binding protein n=1 Tax=Pleionea sp. CnH1-48 TaxID=2954494 RepID=UPI002097D8E6|nr:ATP-binding protein [Pleionea sp. CnH1-48]MCO7226727.1 ATP-binding protein [Pleionea sp. CnH1-48]